MEEIKIPKYSIELKQTAKGVWYLGSLKIEFNNIEEFDSLVDKISLKIEEKINKLNDIDNKDILSKKPAKKKEEIFLNPEEERLFEHLKGIRLELAKKEDYPPYIIFHDSMLKEMAKKRPASLQSMKELIGEKKFEKYGKIFVREIFQFI